VVGGCSQKMITKPIKDALNTPLSSTLLHFNFI
jgi:hypothetical protein